MKAIMTVIGPDRVGIVAGVSALLAKLKAAGLMTADE